MEIITSKSNNDIKLCRSLQDKKFRKNCGLCLLEGIKIVREAKKNNLEIKCIFATQDSYEIVKKEFDSEIIVVSNEIIKYIQSTITPQNVVGIVKTKIFGFVFPKTNFLVLDSIQDPSNLGSIIRSAVATNFTTIYLIDCVDEYNEKVVRSSMGNLFKCKFVHISLDDVTKLSSKLYICDMNGKNIFETKYFDEIVGLCIGNEGHGVCDFIKKQAKNIISIPMANDVESLNASVSASIVMYHIKVNQKEII